MPATYAEALIAEYKQTVLHLTDQLHELQANVNLLKSRVTSLSESNANLLLNVENKRGLIQELTDKVEKLEGDLAFARAPVAAGPRSGNRPRRRPGRPRESGS